MEEIIRLNKQVEVPYYISKDSFTGKLEDIIKYIQKVQLEINEKFPLITNIEVDIEYYSDNMDYKIIGTRLETTEEAKRRIEKEEKLKKQKEERELAIFKELNKKYGK